MMLWGTRIAQLRARLLSKSLLQRGGEARFADARLAGNQRDLPEAGFSALPTPQYLGRLAGPDQRDRTDRGTIKKATNEAPGGLVDRQRAGLRPCLQSCGHD